MKKTIISSILLLFSVMLVSQKGIKGSNIPPIIHLDSIIEYQWDFSTQRWVDKSYTKLYYIYDSSGMTRKETTYDIISKTHISQVLYKYNFNNILNEAISQTWINDKWVNTRRDLMIINDNGLTIEVLIQNPAGEEWVSRIRYTDYIYDNLQLQQYTYQTGKNGQWVDIFYDSWHYDEDGHLIQRDQTLVNGIPLNRFIYVVKDNQRKELILYNWINNKWTENYRRLYEYNPCGELKDVIYQNYINGEWVNSARSEYFYALDEWVSLRKKIPICHNGHTIYVSINAIQAHLNHGDCLGVCFNERDPFESKNENVRGKPMKPPFIIYPNPAKDKTKVKIEPDFNGKFDRLELTDNNGKVLKYYNFQGTTEVEINKGNLRSGQYFLRLVGDQIYSQILIFK